LPLLLGRSKVRLKRSRIRAQGIDNIWQANIWQADARTQQTKQLIRDIKRITRRKFTAEEKIRIVLEGFRRDTPIRDLCRREGIKPSTYYAWLKDFMEAGKDRLTRDVTRDATRIEIQEMKRENARLKTMVAELSLQVHVLKKTAPPDLE